MEDCLMSYKDLRNNIKAVLESKYIQHMASGNSQGMYDVLAELQRYRLIAKDDSRLDKSSFKRFQADGVDTDTKVYKDFRLDNVKNPSSFTGYTTIDTLPDNIVFGKIPFMNVKIKNLGYWGERRELQYRGDIIIPEKDHTYMIASAEDGGKAGSIINSICTLIKKYTGKEFGNLDKFKKMVEIGQIKVGTIRLAGNEEFSVKELGYFFVSSLTNQKIQCKVLMNIDDCIRYRIMLKPAYDTIAQAIYAQLMEVNDKFEIDIAPMVNLDSAIKKQKEIRSKERPLNYEKFCDIENRKLEAEKEEA